MGRIFDLGVRKGGKVMIRGYAEQVYFNLGVRKHYKVENPCFRPFDLQGIFGFNEFEIDILGYWCTWLAVRLG